MDGVVDDTTGIFTGGHTAVVTAAARTADCTDRAVVVEGSVRTRLLLDDDDDTLIAFRSLL